MLEPSLSRFGLFWGMALGAWTSSAAQLGPQFPSHRFPTDKSFHVGYKISRTASDANFVSKLSLQELDDGYLFSFWKHDVQLEYQPNRSLSFGANLSFDQLSLSPLDEGQTVSNSGLGDQRIWGEFRFHDEPGSSLGLGIVVKFPAYTNPTATELESANISHQPLAGDAQSDFTLLATSEFWPSTSVRLRGDFGYTYRSEQHSGELPYLFSAGFVVPKMDIDLKIRGNFSLGSDEFEDRSGAITSIRRFFANSDFAYAINPWVLVFNPTLEFWLNPRWALGLDFQYSVAGTNSPSFVQYGLYMTYRWAQTTRRNTRTFREVGIETDQESGRFQGETQDRDLELRPEDPSPIRTEPDEEIFD